MNKIIKNILSLLGVFLVSTLFLFGVVNAKTLDIEYPISELGNCASQEECKIYCDKDENKIACVDFAEKQKMFEKDKAKQMKEDLKRFEEEMDDFGPGGCITPKECDAYCRVLENLEECLDYGVEHGEQTREEANKILEQAKKGGPGGCHSREGCDSFCSKPENEEECLSFVVEEGKITKEEAEFLMERKKTEEEKREKKKLDVVVDKEEAEKILGEKGGPGGCKTIEECEKYCMVFEHSAECFEFAKENNLLAPKDLEMAEKFSNIKSGPGGCVTDEECDAYCSDMENEEECMSFMKKFDLISDEEIKNMEREKEIMMKMDNMSGINGPGGCKTPEECDAYCKDPSHTEECINFAGEQSGMIKKETIENMMGETKEAQEKLRQIEEEKAKFMEGGDFDNGDSSPSPMHQNEYEESGGEDDYYKSEGEMPPEDFDSHEHEEDLHFMEEGMPSPEEIQKMKEKYMKMMEENGEIPEEEMENFEDMPLPPPEEEMGNFEEMSPAEEEMEQFMEEGL